MATAAEAEETDIPAPRLYTDFIAQAAYAKKDLVGAALEPGAHGQPLTDPQAKNDWGYSENSMSAPFARVRPRLQMPVFFFSRATAAARLVCSQVRSRWPCATPTPVS